MLPKQISIELILDFSYLVNIAKIRTSRKACKGTCAKCMGISRTKIPPYTAYGIYVVGYKLANNTSTPYFCSRRHSFKLIQRTMKLLSILVGVLFCVTSNQKVIAQVDPSEYDAMEKEIIQRRDSLIQDILLEVDQQIQISRLREDSILLCKCSMENMDSTGKEHKTRDVYIYLVKGTNGLDCCNKPALKEYTGFYEKWHKEVTSPSHWALPDSEQIQIESTFAQKFGCSLNNRTIEVAVVADFPQSIDKYYPDLINGKK